MKLNKLFWVIILFSSISCNKPEIKKEVWDFSFSRDKSNTGLKFSKEGEHDDYTPGNLKIIFPENRIFSINHEGYHVYLDEKKFSDVDQLTIYLPEMSAADLEAIYKNYVKNMNLDIGKRKIEVNLNKSSTFCADFANVNFCMRFKAGHGDDKYVGFFQIAMNPIGQKLRKD